MTSGGINISGNTGDVIGVNVSGTGNITGKNITTGNITIGAQDLAGVASEYATALEAFTKSLNALVQKYNVPAAQLEPVQAQLKELAKEVKEVKPDAPVGPVKEANVKAKLANLADTVIKLLPKGAEVIAGFTPLAPFSKIIGQGVESLVKAVQGAA